MPSRTNRQREAESPAIEGEVPVGNDVGQAPGPALSLRDLGKVLVRHYGLTEGLFEVTVTFQLAVGSFGPDPDNLLPSGVIGVHKIGLRRAPAGTPGPGLVDAAEITTLSTPTKRARRPAQRSSV